MTTATKPDYTSRCAYCGEPEPEAWVSCCGERHFEQVPECPVCHDDVEFSRHDAAGIETYVPRCRSCDWVGEPE